MNSFIFTNGLLASFAKSAFLADIVVLIVFIVYALVGAHKGAIRSVIGLVATLTALVIAFRYDDKLASVLGKTIFKGIGAKIEDTFAKINGFDLDISAAGLKESLSGVSLPGFIKDIILDKFADSTLEPGTTLAMLAGSAVTGFIVKILSWFILYFGSKLALSIVARILSKIADGVSVLNAINVFVGALIGIFKALLLVCVVLAILSIIPGEGITSYFDRTIFVKYLFHDNPLIKLLLK
jgi:uncharacterized membrane protein required for colicin V production